jgi:hypothetical protein
MSLEHEGEKDIEGVMWVREDARYHLPKRYEDTDVTIHFTVGTVVVYATGKTRTWPEAVHPGLASDEGIVVALKGHDEDEWHYFELVPVGADPKLFTE